MNLAGIRRGRALPLIYGLATEHRHDLAEGPLASSRGNLDSHDGGHASQNSSTSDEVSDYGKVHDD